MLRVVCDYDSHDNEEDLRQSLICLDQTESVQSKECLDFYDNSNDSGNSSDVCARPTKRRRAQAKYTSIDDDSSANHRFSKGGDEFSNDVLKLATILTAVYRNARTNVHDSAAEMDLLVLEYVCDGRKGCDGCNGCDGGCVSIDMKKWSSNCRAMIKHAKEHIESRAACVGNLIHELEIALFGSVCLAPCGTRLQEIGEELSTLQSRMKTCDMMKVFLLYVEMCCREAVYSSCCGVCMESILTTMYAKQDLPHLEHVLEIEPATITMDSCRSQTIMHHYRCQTALTFLTGKVACNNNESRPDQHFNQCDHFLQCFRRMVITTRCNCTETICLGKLSLQWYLDSSNCVEGVVPLLAAALVHLFASRIPEWSSALHVIVIPYEKSMKFEGIHISRILRRKLNMHSKEKEEKEENSTLKHSAAARRATHRDLWWRELSFAFTCYDISRQRAFGTSNRQTVRMVELTSDNYVKMRWDLFSPWLRERLSRVVFTCDNCVNHSTIRVDKTIPAGLARTCIDARRALASRVPLTYALSGIWPSVENVQKIKGVTSSAWLPTNALLSRAHCFKMVQEWLVDCGATNEQLKVMENLLNDGLPTHNAAFDFIYRTITYHYHTNEI